MTASNIEQAVRKVNVIWMTSGAAALQGGGSSSRQWQLEWVRDTPCLHTLSPRFVGYASSLRFVKNERESGWGCRASGAAALQGGGHAAGDAASTSRTPGTVYKTVRSVTPRGALRAQAVLSARTRTRFLPRRSCGGRCRHGRYGRDGCTVIAARAGCKDVCPLARVPPSGGSGSGASAPFTNPQGVALGWYVTPFQGFH